MGTKLTTFVHIVAQHFKQTLSPSKKNQIDVEGLLQILEPIIYVTKGEQKAANFEVKNDADVKLMNYLYEQTNRIPSMPESLENEEFI